MKTFLSLMAIGLFALAFVTSSTDAYAAAGLLVTSTTLVPVAALGAGSVARLVADHMGPRAFGPRIAFDKPNEGGFEGKTVEELAANVKKMVDEAVGKVKAIAEEALGKAKAGETLTEGVKTKADEALVKMNTLNEQLAALEQAVAKRAKGGEDDAHKSAGQLFTEDDKVKSFLGTDPSSGKVDVRIKATLTSLTTDAAGSVGDAIQNTRLPGILPLPQRRLTVRDLLSTGRMDGSTLEYVKETGFVNNAAPVAEGASKPSSDIKLDLVTTSAKVIAHWMKASKQVLSDISQLKSIIDQRLLYGLAYVEEAQLLSGDGTGQNLLGIIPQATGYAAPIALADLNILDVLRLSMLQAALAEYPATGHVLNPIDWAGIETLKDTTGRYIIGNPQGTTSPTLWGLPVVATQAMTVNKFLTGAFKLGAQLFDRWDARVESGFVNDDFIKNLVTIQGVRQLSVEISTT